MGANWTVPADTKPTWNGYGHSLILDEQGNPVFTHYLRNFWAFRLYIYNR
jgi:hypothetical protein